MVVISSWSDISDESIPYKDVLSTSQADVINYQNKQAKL